MKLSLTSISTWAALLFLPCTIAPEFIHPVEEFVVWNVGQGSWSTYVTNQFCFHFDSGGDHAPFAALRTSCKNRQNRFYYSHWDWDHIRFAETASKSFDSACLGAPPAGQGAQWKQNKFKNFQPCSRQADQEPREISRARGSRIETPSARKTLQSANEVSRIFVMKENFVLPGDSNARAEKDWAQRIPSRPKILVLGHHGSQTSTSELLLEYLGSIEQAVASADRKRYGHPHPKVLARLRAHGVATLKTEDWGSIHFVRKDHGR
jgi:competence protein ComEC